MRDALPARVLKNESAIVNLDDSNSTGSHWVAYAKRGHLVIYYDSYGNLRPPPELVRYWNTGSAAATVTVRYNYKRDQKVYNCGHLCLKFLSDVFHIG